jgi:phosphoglucomutase
MKMATEIDLQASLRQWLEHPLVSQETKEAIAQMTAAEQKEAFGQELAFGTGGIRGIMGPGAARLNLYTIQRAVLGVAAWLNAQGREKAIQGVAIAYDTRLNSRTFSSLAACTLAAKGIPVFLFDEPAPTPTLSFAVRKLGCAAGMVLTASHNPKEYNGLKVYDATGVQLNPTDAEEVTACIRQTPLFSALPLTDTGPGEGSGMISRLGEEMKEDFLAAVLSQSILPEPEPKESMRVAYTPLHGAGNRYVREALALAGFGRVTAVAQQEQPDGSFPTVQYPNPEDPAALALAVALAKAEDGDLVIGTDPDSDRLGAAVRKTAAAPEYLHLTGNQIGALLIDYILTRKRQLGTLPAKGVVLNTIVTSDLGAAVARSHGMRVASTLTGFKYIGEQINLLQAAGEEAFIFGYEESNGYLSGAYARDKDAVAAALLLCEAAAFQKQQQKTLAQRLGEIYQEHGYYLDALDNFFFPGSAGVAHMSELMENLRQKGPAFLPEAAAIEDYAAGVGSYPRENVLKYRLQDGSWLACRPSGTEPKLKVYYSVRAAGQEAAEKVLAGLREKIKSIFGPAS